MQGMDHRDASPSSLHLHSTYGSEHRPAFHTWTPVNQSDAGKANCCLVALLSLAAATLMALLSPRLWGFPAPAFFTLLRPGQVAFITSSCLIFATVPLRARTEILVPLY